MVWRVRVFGSITERMVHPVQNGVSARTQIRGTLGEIGQEKEKAFPYLAHREHFVSRIPVQKKCLAEKRYVPVNNKGNKDYYHGIKFVKGEWLKTNFSAIRFYKSTTITSIINRIRQNFIFYLFSQKAVVEYCNRLAPMRKAC